MDASFRATYNSFRQSRLPNQTFKSSCFCGDSSPPELHALSAYDESGMEAIFQHFSQGMQFWERLRPCRLCLEAHTHCVLDMVENVIRFLNNNVIDTAVSSISAPGTHSRSNSATARSSSTARSSNNSIGSAPQSFAQPRVPVVAPSRPSLAAALENLPPMSLGQFTLDSRQGATLIRSIYRRMLRQIASILYEMHQMEYNQRVQIDRELVNHLIPVLQLLEAIER
ncbi:hypothetical protein BDV11DRAFT_211620 [Aspergillus similis]